MPLDGTGIWEPKLVVSKSETIQRINEDLKENKNSEPATLYCFVDGTTCYLLSDCHTHLKIRPAVR